MDDIIELDGKTYRVDISTVHEDNGQWMCSAWVLHQDGQWTPIISLDMIRYLAEFMHYRINGQLTLGI